MLKNKVAIITGASRGIGKAIAVSFASAGAKVIVNYHREESLAENVVEEIKQENGIAMAIQADVADEKAVISMVDSTLSAFKGVDIIVNNAGIAIGGGSLLEYNEKEFDPMWRVNVNGILYCTRTVAPYMMKKRYGKIVNIGSVAGLGTARLPGNMLYASTKAAVGILTKRLALELGQYGINVNAIAPGMIRTDMGMNWADSDEHVKYYEENSILKRIGEPKEIANTALFLASDQASFITAQVLTVDGGRIDFITHSS